MCTTPEDHGRRRRGRGADRVFITESGNIVYWGTWFIDTSLKQIAQQEITDECETKTVFAQMEVAVCVRPQQGWMNPFVPQDSARDTISLHLYKFNCDELTHASLLINLNFCHLHVYGRRLLMISIQAVTVGSSLTSHCRRILLALGPVNLRREDFTVLAILLPVGRRTICLE